MVVKEALWITSLVKKLGILQDGVQLYCDSQNFIYLVNNQVYHARINYIDVRSYRTRKLVSSGELLFEKVYNFKDATCRTPKKRKFVFATFDWRLSFCSVLLTWFFGVAT